MSNYISSWLENFERQAMIRRALLINGNIIDLSFSRSARILPVNKIIEDSLRALGFREVIFFSSISGIKGISEQDFKQLMASQMTFEQGQDYDFEDYKDSDYELEVAQEAATSISVQDFFATIEKVLTDPLDTKKIAFIVDWSNYLFGQVNALSEMERSYLQRIAQSLRDTVPSQTPQQMREPQSIVIFLCQGNSSIPPILFVDNPLCAHISIPKPSIKEREAAIMAQASNFITKDLISAKSKSFAELVTLTDALTLRDLNNLARLSRQQDEILDISSLVSLYRYGTKESPWEQLNYQRIKSAKQTLQKRVKGQDQAIEAVNKVLIRAYTGLSGLQHSSKSRTPKGALFFVGPTGVGKTELAKSLAQFLFGDEDACIRFDMSEFNHEHADQRLIGAPPGYVGYEEGGQLTNAVKAKPFSLLLFDEIEKAHPRILDKFLQILEDGRLTDGKGETISFADTFIVFTSNIGASYIKPDNNDLVASQFKEAVQNHFTKVLNRPELLGRIGDANIIPFNFMTDVFILKEIARSKLLPLKERLKDKWGIIDMKFVSEDQALEAIIKQMDVHNGGRGVLNAMIKFLFDPLSEFLFENTEHPELIKGHSISIINIEHHFTFLLE